MNYRDYIKQTYQLQPSNNNEACAYFSDGDTQIVELEQNAVDYSSVEELCYRVANNVNRQYSNYSTTMLVGFSVQSGTDLFYISTNKADFYTFSCFNESFNVSAVIDYDLNSNVDDYTGINNYTTITAYGVYNDTSTTPRGEFNFALTNNKACVFDYTNLYYENGTYTQDVKVIRGENVSFYNVYLYVDGFEHDNVYISYGAPYGDIANSEYQRGYGNGFASGWVQGNENGYQIGVNSGVNPTTATAFTYISETFNAVGGLLELEVLPHITLGLCFSIPLVFVLIMTLFKLVRK